MGFLAIALKLIKSDVSTIPPFQQIISKNFFVILGGLEPNPTPAFYAGLYLLSYKTSILEKNNCKYLLLNHSRTLRIAIVGLKNQILPLTKSLHNLVNLVGDSDGARTRDPGIKSAVLYQLSYGV